ncbi:MAG: dihydrolipoamide dehydrogenase [Deltaproteobacteria bacterium SG8_13]|nr:MAG: dihydrolipoamide dehydrogenase [Deltaproteobacteria bacterium SG8_13]
MAEPENYDLVIVGGGPGGYVAAVKAAQLKMKVACVEKASRLGGVCLRKGCIPSKALLDSSEYYHLAKEKFAAHGIKTGRVSVDLPTMMARKEEVVKSLTDNVRSLLQRNKVEIIHGKAKLAGNGRVEVAGENQSRTLQAGKILLATGSEPVSVPGLEFDGEHIVDSSGALYFDAVPKALGVVGGGYIGLELGSVWLRLGAKVTVIEMLPQIAALLDGQVARTLLRILKKQGMEFHLTTRVAAAKVANKKVKVTVEKDDQKLTLTFDRLLVAVGRRPLTRGLNLEETGIRTDSKTGHIIVDETFQTSVSGVYAIGDLIAGPALAHKASAEGIAAVECMAGLPGEVNYDAVPAVIYTAPEVASVGLTEEQVKERKIPYCTGTYPFTGAGRARCMGETDGFVKVISHQKTDRILGVHIIGARAADMIAEAVLAVEMGASAEDIARTVHGHPTFAEALMEAAMSASSCSIYSA